MAAVYLIEGKWDFKGKAGNRNKKVGGQTRSVIRIDTLCLVRRTRQSPRDVDVKYN